MADNDETTTGNATGDGDDASVLDPVTGDGATDGGDDDGDTTGDGEGGGDGGSNDDDLVDRVMERLRPQLDEIGDRIADRTVNTALKEIRKAPKPNDDQSGNDGSSEPAKPSGDVRTTRLAFREYLGDEMAFVSNEERGFAMDLGAALIAQRATDGIDDEDRTGREVANTVAAKVTEMRKHYEKLTKAALKRRGLLADTGSKQPPKGPGTPGGQSEFEKGAELAKAKFGQPASS